MIEDTTVVVAFEGTVEGVSPVGGGSVTGQGTHETGEDDAGGGGGLALVLDADLLTELTHEAAAELLAELLLEKLTEVHEGRLM